MRLPSCVIYRGHVALCISEVAGRIEARAAGARVWLTEAEAQEAVELLERDRLMLADGSISREKRGDSVASAA